MVVIALPAVPPPTAVIVSAWLDTELDVTSGCAAAAQYFTPFLLDGVSRLTASAKFVRLSSALAPISTSPSTPGVVVSVVLNV